MDEYPDVRIEWIRHHNPELAVFVDGAKTQTIDLSGYNYGALHRLFASHFTRRQAGRALAVDAEHSANRSVNSTGAPVPAPVRSYDAAVPKPTPSGWHAADVDRIAELGSPTYLVLLALSAIALVLLARCSLRRPAPSKPPAMDV